MAFPFRPSHLLGPLLVVATQACTRAPNPEIGRYESVPCPLPVPDGREVACGFLSVPERHDRPQGPVIQLAVAQFKSANPDAAPDPLVLNNGGPGDSNFEGFFPVMASPIGDALLAQRDVVLVELRGLYHSRPNLLTEEVFEVQSAMVGQDIKGPEANALLLDAMERARARFVAEGIDLPAYRHDQMAADIAFVMGELGYDRFNLFGTSAGTMVAQAVLRDYPERLRAVVMNAAVPNGPALFERMLLNAAASLERYFRMCDADATCAAAYGDIESRFFDMLAALDRAPVTLEVTDPRSGEPTSLVLNGDKVASWVFTSLYWNTQILRSLDRFARGDFRQIQDDPGVLFPLSRFAYALGYTVVIGDNPGFTAELDAGDARYQRFVDGIALFFSPRLMEATRDLWTDGTAPGARGPLVSDVPTLILNGALDHVIPKDDLDALAAGLSNGHVFVFEGVAHSPVDVGDCALGMMMAFLADPSGAPDASCVADFHHGFALPE